MLRNNLLLLFLFFWTFLFSQGKKVDTVYVYEKIYVHDTIFIEKNVEKIKFENAVLKQDSSTKKNTLEVLQNGKIIQISIDTLKLKVSKTSIKNKFIYGLKFQTGISDNTLLKEFNSNSRKFIGLGFFVKRSFIVTNLFVGLGINGNYIFNSGELNSSENDTNLSGYYFNQNNEPKLFQSLTNSNFQVLIPFQFYYKINKIMPSVGVFAKSSNYKASFLASSRNLPISFDEIQSYKASVIQYGYLSELNYQYSKKILFGINYMIGFSNHIPFVKENNKGDFFTTNTKIKEINYGFQVIYNL